MRKDARRNDAAFVGHQQIAGAQQIGQVVEMPVRELARRSIELQKPRSIARLDRGLGNQFGRQVIIKIARLHLFTIRMMMFKMIVATTLTMIMLTIGMKQLTFCV